MIVFFFNDTATTEIYTLSLHDALPICDAVLVLYTDGLVERRDQDLDHGLDRLRQALEDLAGRDLDELCDELLTCMLDGHSDDDVALIALRLHRQDRPRPPAAGPNQIGRAHV